MGPGLARALIAAEKVQAGSLTGAVIRMVERHSGTSSTTVSVRTVSGVGTGAASCSADADSAAGVTGVVVGLWAASG